MAPKPANGGANPRSPETAALLRQIAELSGAINRKKAIDAAVNEAKSRGSQPTTPRNTALSSSAGQKKPPTAFNGSIMPATTQQAKKPAASRNMKLVNGTGPNPTKTAQSSETTSKQSLGPVPPADLPKNQTNSVVQSTDLPPQWVKKRAHQLILRSALPSVGTSTLSARRRVQDTLGFSAPQLFTKKTPQKTLTLPQSPAAARLRTVTPGGRVEINGVVYKKSLRGNKFTRLGAETPRTASASAAAKTNQPRGSKKQTVMIRGLPYVRDPRKPHTLVLKSVSDAAAVAAAVGKQQKPMPKAVELNGKLYIRTVNGNLRLASKAARRKSLGKISKLRFCTFFTRFGVCRRGAACHYIHSPAHRALCPLFLLQRSHDTCTLSHEPSEFNRVLCRHFQTGRCRFGETCRFAHVKLPETAPVCKEFAATGWCDRGESCLKKHYRICPEEEEKGECKDDACRMPHMEKGKNVDASRVKKNTGRPSDTRSVASSALEDDQLFGFDFEDPEQLPPENEDEEEDVDMEISDVEDEEDEDVIIELGDEDEIEVAVEESVLDDEEHEEGESEQGGAEMDQVEHVVDGVERDDEEEAPDVIVLEGEESAEGSAEEEEEDGFVGLGIVDGDEEEEAVDFEVDEPPTKRARVRN